MVRFLASNYWKLAVGDCSQQVNAKHHLGMFMFIYLFIFEQAVGKSSLVLLKSTYAALGIGLMMY